MDTYEDIFDSRGHLYNEAGSRWPAAREQERRVLLDLFDPKAGEILCDAPAGGGYVADGIRARLGDRVRIICIEPAQRSASAIHSAFEILHDPMDSLSLKDRSVDGVASLAGMHHFEDKMPVFREWSRVVKESGRVSIADVEADTDVAHFLNTFVDAWTPGGHDGSFVKPGEFSDSLKSSGFSSVTEKLQLVPWQFPDEQTMAVFCRTLFGITRATEEQVLVGLRQHLQVSKIQGGVELGWRLRYAHATR